MTSDDPEREEGEGEDRTRVRGGDPPDPGDGEDQGAAVDDGDAGERVDEGEATPFADLAADVAGRTTEGDEVFDDAFFEEVAVDVDIDETSAWEELFREDPVEAPQPSTSEGESYVVDKTMCHACPYFGDPPALECEHEGTEIVEVVDTGHFLVVDCPMVDAEHTP